MNSIGNSVVIVEVPQAMETFVKAACVRLGYLFPDWIIEHDRSVIVVTMPAKESVDIVRKEALYALYREKIFAQTLQLRNGLLDLVQSK